MFSALLLITAGSLLPLSSARAVWIPGELQRDAADWIPEDFSPLAKRANTCGGDASLSQCGSSFPSDFCCPTGAQCLSLNTTSSITAVLCCPAGQDCTAISSINCDLGIQNATSAPTSYLHVDPPTVLETCGSACCPFGYTCRDGGCTMQTTNSTSSTATPSSTVSLASPTADTLTTTAALPTAKSNSNGFSGASFAAGFVPGIFLGALAAAALIICLIRKERRKNQPVMTEKHRSKGRDTLTDLGPAINRKPTVHGRSISEPIVDNNLGNRTDFLNSSPSSQGEGVTQGGPSSYAVHIQANRSSTPPSDPKIENKSWLSRSPFMPQRTPELRQSPVPTHLKRGTLSFQISPLRALRKQRSMHSLRRQMTEASTRSNSARNKRPDLSRTGSTETIQVLMDTPGPAPSTPPKSRQPLATATYYPTVNNNAGPYPLSTADTWETTHSDSDDDRSTPIEEEPNTYTPTRPGRNSNVANVGASLASPYTPSNYPPSTSSPPTTVKTTAQQAQTTLAPPPIPGIPDMNRDSTWRNTAATTFSVMMEKAGLSKTQLLMGPDPRDWNKK